MLQMNVFFLIFFLYAMKWYYVLCKRFSLEFNDYKVATCVRTVFLSSFIFVSLMNMNIGEFACDVKSSVRFWVVLGAHFYFFSSLLWLLLLCSMCLQRYRWQIRASLILFVLLQWTAYRQSWSGDLRQQSIAWQFCFYSSSWERCHWQAQHWLWLLKLFITC